MLPTVAHAQAEMSILRRATARGAAAPRRDAAAVHLPVINQMPFVRFLGDPDWIRLLTGRDLRHRRARHQPAHRASPVRCRSATRSSWASAPTQRSVLGGESSRQPVGSRPPDLDLAARRRHLRRARRDPRVADRGAGPRAVPRHRHRRPRVHRHPPVEGAPRDLRRRRGRAATSRRSTSACGRRTTRSSTSPSDGHWLWFDITGTRRPTCSASRCWCCVTLVAEEHHPHPYRARAAGDPRPRRRRRGDGRAGGQVQADRVRRRSSFFAGVAGALFASFVGKLPPETLDLILSVEFIAILLIGGAGTDGGRADRHVLRRAVAALRRGDRRLGRRAGRAGRCLGQRLGPVISSGAAGDGGLISTADVGARVRTAGEPPRRTDLRRHSSSSSCCSSRSVSTGSGSRSATTGRDGRSATDRRHGRVLRHTKFDR